MRIAYAALMFLVVALLGGCSAGNDAEGFRCSGAYCAEIEETRETTESEFVRQALADGIVSDAEMSEAIGRARDCIMELGATNVTFYSDGSMTTEWETEEPEIAAENTNEEGIPGEGVSRELECELSSGDADLSALFYAMAANPDNEDMDELMLECLKKTGTVEPAFSKEQLEAAFENPEAYPSLTNDAHFGRCMNDPLGLLPEQPSEIQVP